MLLKQKLFSGEKFSKNDELLKLEKYFEFYIRKKHQLDEMINFEEMNNYLSKHFMIIIKHQKIQYYLPSEEENLFYQNKIQNLYFLKDLRNLDITVRIFSLFQKSLCTDVSYMKQKFVAYLVK